MRRHGPEGESLPTARRTRSNVDLLSRVVSRRDRWGGHTFPTGRSGGGSFMVRWRQPVKGDLTRIPRRILSDLLKLSGEPSVLSNPTPDE